MESIIQNNGVEALTIKEVDKLPPVTLAYIGDAVYDYYVRCWVASRVAGAIDKLHRETIRYVNAGAQANIVRLLDSAFTDMEQDLIRKGRNIKSGRVPKNASVGDYRLATGWEALLGFLYLKGEKDRVEQLIFQGLTALEHTNGLSNKTENKGDES